MAIAVLALPASAVAAGPHLNVVPTAMRLGPPTDINGIGRGSFASSRWSTEAPLDGRHSVRVEVAPTPDPVGLAGARVLGVAGMSVGSLGNLSLASDVPCVGISPRFIVFYDSSGDGDPDGSLLYACGDHPTPPPAPGWDGMSAPAATPDAIAPINRDAPPFQPGVAVTEVLAITHEPGVMHMDRFGIAGAVIGDPGGR